MSVVEKAPKEDPLLTKRGKVQDWEGLQELLPSNLKENSDHLRIVQLYQQARLLAHHAQVSKSKDEKEEASRESRKVYVELDAIKGSEAFLERNEPLLMAIDLLATGETNRDDLPSLDYNPN